MLVGVLKKNNKFNLFTLKLQNYYGIRAEGKEISLLLNSESDCGLFLSCKKDYSRVLHHYNNYMFEEISLCPWKC